MYFGAISLKRHFVKSTQQIKIKYSCFLLAQTSLFRNNLIISSVSYKIIHFFNFIMKLIMSEVCKLLWWSRQKEKDKYFSFHINC